MANEGEIFRALTGPLEDPEAERRNRIVAAADNPRVRRIANAFVESQSYNAKEAYEALAPFDLRPWDIDQVIPVSLHRQEDSGYGE